MGDYSIPLVLCDRLLDEGLHELGVPLVAGVEQNALMLMFGG
ncbi:MAG: hypothetical protein ACI9FJ_003370 [Alteromonadaceae bacterium]|jgi:hypothetical protein